LSNQRIIKLAPWLFLLLWCGGFTVAKIGFTGAEPFTLLSIRYCCVVALLLPILFWLKPEKPGSWRQVAHIAWVGFLIQVVHFGCVWLAMHRGGSAANVALITSLQPILVALLVPSLANEKVSLVRWLGLLLGLTGCVWVILSNNALGTISTFVVTFSVLGLLGITIATVWEKRFAVSQHILISSLIQYSVGAACVIPVAVLTETMQVEVTPRFVFALSYLVVCNSILAISLLLLMIREGEVTRVSSLFFLVPPGTAVIAWIVLGERMVPMAWVGMAIAVVGVWLVGRQTLKPGRDR